MPGPKIITCCYCGHRAVFNFAQQARHELVCTACGAALTAMEPIAPAPAPRPVPKPEYALRDSWEDRAQDDAPRKPKKSKKRKRKKDKDPMARFFEEALDTLDDIFD